MDAVTALPLTPEAREELRALQQTDIAQIRRAAQEFYDSAESLKDTPGMRGLVRSRNLSGNALVDAADRYAALLTDSDRLSGRLKEAQTPTIFWNADDREVGYSDAAECVDELDVHDVMEVECARHLPNIWAAHIATQFSDDGKQVEDSEIQVFDTEAEAREAIAKSRATPTEPAPE